VFHAKANGCQGGEFMAVTQPVTLTINGRKIEAKAGQTILEVARANGIDIPNLCDDPRIEPIGACRMCIVEVEGARGLQTACTYKIQPDMVVRTETEQIVQTRKDILEFMLAEHRVSCTTCDKNGECRLMDYAYRYGADECRFGVYQPPPPEPNYTSEHKGIEYDPTKCIKCQRCVRICAEVEQAHTLTLKNRAYDVVVSTAFDLPLNETTCEHCGLCVSTCPTGALYDRAAKGMGMAKDLVKTRQVRLPLRAFGRPVDHAPDPQGWRAGRDRLGDRTEGGRGEAGGDQVETWTGRIGGCQFVPLHQRGELSVAEVGACGLGHEQHRPMREYVTRAHRGRSGHIIRQRRDDEQHR